MNVRLGIALLASILVATPTMAQRAREHHPRLFIVDASGAPDADFETLGAAVRAAFDGDRILVRDGFYGALEIVGKTLTIEADSARRSYVTGITVRGLAPSQFVTVRGLHIAEEGGPPPEVALAVRACAGSVWVEELGLEERTADFQSHLVLVENSDSVVLSRCNLFAGSTPQGRAVIDLRDSTSYLFDSRVSGKDGQTLIRVDGGFVGLYGTTLERCGFYCDPPVPLYLTGASPVAQIQGGGMDGTPVVESGSLDHLTSLARSHHVSSPGYDDEQVTVDITGQAGDLVWLRTSVRPARGSFLPLVDAPWFLPNSAVSYFIGTMSSQTLSFQQAIGDLPPGSSSRLVFQTLHVSSGPGEIVLSEPTVVTFHDAALRAVPHAFSADPAWTDAPASSVAFGASVASAGDVNGDGYGDVIVGDPAFDYSGTLNNYLFHGRVHVYLGSATGLSSQADWVEVGAVNSNTVAGPAGLGTAVGSAGDVNGDGYGDVYVTRESPNMLFVYYGSPSGVSSAGATAIWVGSVFDGKRHIAAVGDVNGDGFDDMWSFTGSYGNLYHGSASGLATTPGWTHTLPIPACCSPSGVAAAGDVNGDGFADLLIKWYWSPSPGHRPSISLILGGAPPTFAWTYENENSYYSPMAGVGDLDQDGFDDLVLGAAPDRLLVFHGASPAPAPEPDEVVATPFCNAFWAVIRPSGDADGDGRPDLLVIRDESSARVWSLLRGAGTGPMRSPIWTRTSSSFGEVAVVGDVNGDGALDVAAGSYDGHLSNGADGGSVQLFLGTP